MLEKNIEDIFVEDLQSLIDNEVPEGKRIEYKQELPGNSDSEKKEFLSDVSSFANTLGGHIIYGIIEDRSHGIPKSLEGVSIANPDQEINRLENIIKQGIEPRIPHLDIKSITLSNSNKVIIIQISKSWIYPHCVSFKGSNKFFSRTSIGKFPMDVSELRIAFNLSETMTERVRNFRKKRVTNILKNKYPVNVPQELYNKPKTIMHLIPIESFNPGQNSRININSENNKINPLKARNLRSRYNLDGLCKYNFFDELSVNSYVQVFRNGIIETVDISLIRDIIPINRYEEVMINKLKEYLKNLHNSNIETPIFVYLTIIGARGVSIPNNNDYYYDEEDMMDMKSDRDTLCLPEVIIEQYDEKPEKILKPIFDSIWNACGYQGSENYDKNGERKIIIK